MHVLNACLMLPVSLEPESLQKINVSMGHEKNFYGIIKHMLSYWLLEDNIFILYRHTKIP